jgi:hypothetical protein
VIYDLMSVVANENGEVIKYLNIVNRHFVHVISIEIVAVRGDINKYFSCIILVILSLCDDKKSVIEEAERATTGNLHCQISGSLKA